MTTDKFYKVVKNEFYGYPDEWFPSISATIGDWYPSRNIFQIACAIASGEFSNLDGLVSSSNRLLSRYPFLSCPDPNYLSRNRPSLFHSRVFTCDDETTGVYWPVERRSIRFGRNRSHQDPRGRHMDLHHVDRRPFHARRWNDLIPCSDLVLHGWDGLGKQEDFADLGSVAGANHLCQVEDTVLIGIYRVNSTISVVIYSA